MKKHSILKRLGSGFLAGRRTAAGDRCLLHFVQAATVSSCRPLHRRCIGRQIASGGTPSDVQFTLCKVDAETSMAIGKSSVDGSTAVYGIYSDNACKNKVAEITIGEDGMGSVKLKSGRRTAAGDHCLM